MTFVPTLEEVFRKAWIIPLLILAVQADSSEVSSTASDTTDGDNLLPNWCGPLETTFENNTIFWPEVGEYGEYVHSTPICLDALKFPKYRYIDDGCLQPGINLKCSYIQSDKITSDCPNSEPTLVIKNEHKFCFSSASTNAARWDYKQCLRYGTSILDILKYSKDNSKYFTTLKYIKNNFGHKFWLPIRRENSYSPLQYYLPLLWKRYVNLDGISGKGDCLAIEIFASIYKLRLEECEKHYPILCAYDALDHRQIDCTNDTYVLYAHTDIAKYAYVQNGSSCRYGRISFTDSPETSKVYKMLINDEKCSVNVFPYKDINIPPVNTTNYLSVAPCGKNCALNITDWVARFSEIEYFNWNADDIGYGEQIVVDSSGRWSLNNNSQCTICEDTIGSSTVPTLMLESNRDHRLTLIISVEHLTTIENAHNDSFDNLCNFKKLLGINCFAQYDQMRFENFHLNELTERNFNTYSSENILTAIDIVGISYNEVYSIRVNKSGRFWCEGYSAYHNLVISSDDLYVAVADETENFAVIVKVIGIDEELNSYKVRSIPTVLEKVIKSKMEYYSDALSAVQLKHFITIDYAKHELVALVHFEMMRPELDDDGDEIDDFYELLLAYRNALWGAMKLHNETQFTFYAINHTQYCLPDISVVHGTKLVWGAAKLNEYVTTEDFDLEENGLPIVRQCIGNYLYGLRWDLVNELNGGGVTTGGLVTRELLDLERLMATQSNESLNILKNISSTMGLNVAQLIPADLFTISKVLSYLDAFNFRQYNSSQNFDGMSDITAIIDSCTLANETVIQKSQLVNTSNTILYSFEMAVNNIGRALKPKRDTFVIRSPNVLVVVLNPGANNISGISVYKNLTKTVQHNDITDYYIEYILSNASITTFKEGFTIGSYVPENLLENLLAINQKLQIIITLFYNDALYQDETHADQLDSIIISVTMPGISSRLPGFMPFYFTSRSQSTYTLTSNASMNHNNYCSYWNFQPKNKTLKSQWSQDGCHFMGLLTTTKNTTQISACACEHLTSFAFLVGDLEITKNSGPTISIADKKALNIISLLGCSLSILGTFGIFITALVFPAWRRKSYVLLQFSAAIALQMSLTMCVTTYLFDFKVTPNMQWTMCITMGASVQYSLLVVFSWTLISAYLQFKRYVSVFNSKPSNLYLKIFIVGWLLPLVPVLLGVFISPDSYTNPIADSFNVCYPGGYALYFTVLLPIVIIFLANLTIFIIVVRNVFRMSSNKFHSNEKDLILSQLRLSVFLFFLLGLTWFFGLATALKIHLIFTYLFCLTATVQGLVLFVYFVLMDPETRARWRNLLCCKSHFREKLHT